MIHPKGLILLLTWEHPPLTSSLRGACDLMERIVQGLSSWAFVQSVWRSGFLWGRSALQSPHTHDYEALHGIEVKHHKDRAWGHGRMPTWESSGRRGSLFMHPAEQPRCGFIIYTQETPQVGLLVWVQITEGWRQSSPQGNILNMSTSAELSAIRGSHSLLLILLFEFRMLSARAL